MKKILEKIIFFNLIIIFIVSSFGTVYGYNINYNSAEFYYPDGGTVEDPLKDAGSDDRTKNTGKKISLIDTPSISVNISEIKSADVEQQIPFSSVSEIDIRKGQMVHDDSSFNFWEDGTKGIKLELEIGGKTYGPIWTNGNREYTFENALTNVAEGDATYKIKYTYPGVEESDISSITTIDEAKEKQQILKYNAQDFISTDNSNELNILFNRSAGSADVFLLLDCSKSMDDIVNVNGIEMSKLAVEKELALNLVDKLLVEDANIRVGLIVFGGLARKLVSLTSDKDYLKEKIREVTTSSVATQGYTNIISAIDKATSNKNVGFTHDAHNFIFLLSDGIPTWDGDINNIIFNLRNGNEEEIKRENDRKLNEIMKNTKNKIKEVEGKKITIYSIISREELDEELTNELRKIYTNEYDGTNNKYKEVENSADFANVDDVVLDFENYVKSSINVRESCYRINEKRRIQDENLLERFKEKYKDFNYSNTEYFRALDMEIKTNEDVNKFKNYALRLLRDGNIKVTMESEGKVQVKHDQLPNVGVKNYWSATIKDKNGNERNVTKIEKEIVSDPSNANQRIEKIYTNRVEKNADGSEYVVHELSEETTYVLESKTANAGPIYMIPIEGYEIAPTISVTNMKVYATNGNLIVDKSTNFNEDQRDELLFSDLEEKQMYGSKVILEYTAKLTNKSIIEDTSQLKLVFYIPDGFTYDNSYGIIAIGKGLNNKTYYLNFDEEPYMITEEKAKALVDSNQMSPDLYDKYIKNGHNAVMMKINTQKDDFKLHENGEIYLKLYVGKILSTDKDEDTSYFGDIELVGYSNESNRRLQYNSGKGTGLLGATAGNYEKAELDYAKSNQAMLIVPTGKEKNIEKIVQIGTSIAIITGMIFIIGKNIKKSYRK